MTDVDDSPRPELSRRVDLGTLDRGPRSVRVSAAQAERAALARRFGILEVERLEAELRVQWVAGGPYVRVTGRLSADVVQECVVSLEPVRGTVSEVVNLRYGPPQLDQPEVDVGLDEEEPPEPIEGGEIEVGEPLAQQLALALDPYPRAPGAELEATAAGEVTKEEEEARNPFAALSKLRLKGN